MFLKVWTLNYLGKVVENIDAWVPLRPSESESLVEGPRNLHPRWVWHLLKPCCLKYSTGPTSLGTCKKSRISGHLPISWIKVCMLTGSPWWFLSPLKFEKHRSKDLRTFESTGFFSRQILWEGSGEARHKQYSFAVQVMQHGTQSPFCREPRMIPVQGGL